MLGLLSVGAAAVSVPTTAGLYFRAAQYQYDADTGGYSMTITDSEYQSEADGYAGGWYVIVGQFVYVDGGGNERIVPPSDLTVQNGALCSLYPSSDSTTLVFLSFNLTGAYTVSYGDFGSVVFQAKLPSFGFYSAASATEGDLLYRWDYDGTIDTIFFAAHDQK